jgi:hypothetical protein
LKSEAHRITISFACTGNKNILKIQLKLSDGMKRRPGKASESSWKCFSRLYWVFDVGDRECCERLKDFPCLLCILLENLSWLRFRMFCLNLLETVFDEDRTASLIQFVLRHAIFNQKLYSRLLTSHHETGTIISKVNEMRYVEW